MVGTNVDVGGSDTEVSLLVAPKWMGLRSTLVHTTAHTSSTNRHFFQKVITWVYVLFDCTKYSFSIFSTNERTETANNFRHYQKFITTGTCVMNLDPVKKVFWSTFTCVTNLSLKTIGGENESCESRRPTDRPNDRLTDWPTDWPTDTRYAIFK
jgi:hypothetical protein